MKLNKKMDNNYIKYINFINGYINGNDHRNGGGQCNNNNNIIKYLNGNNINGNNIINDFDGNEYHFHLCGLGCHIGIEHMLFNNNNTVVIQEFGFNFKCWRMNEYEFDENDENILLKDDENKNIKNEIKLNDLNNIKSEKKYKMEIDDDSKSDEDEGTTDISSDDVDDGTMKYDGIN